MNTHVSAIILGVQDVARAKQFYEGLGWTPHQDYGQFVTFSLGDGSSLLGLYTWDALAADAGVPARVPADGNGFRGVAFSYLVRDDDRVTELLKEAEQAGGTIVRPAENAQWGGAFGYFADPDGNLWKVASGSGPQPYAE